MASPVNFGLNEDYPRKVDILAVCGGRVTKEFRNIVAGSISRTGLGATGP
jgi:hypothetical protein